MRSRIHDGEFLDLIAPYDVLVDEPVLMGNIFGVAFNSARKGESMVLDTRGVHMLQKKTPEAVRAGGCAFFDSKTQQIVATAKEHTAPVGYFTRDEKEDSALCLVRLTATCRITDEAAGIPS